MPATTTDTPAPAPDEMAQAVQRAFDEVHRALARLEAAVGLPDAAVMFRARALTTLDELHARLSQLADDLGRSAT